MLVFQWDVAHNSGDCTVTDVIIIYGCAYPARSREGEDSSTLSGQRKGAFKFGVRFTALATFLFSSTVTLTTTATTTPSPASPLPACNKSKQSVSVYKLGCERSASKKRWKRRRLKWTQWSGEETHWAPYTALSTLADGALVIIENRSIGKVARACTESSWERRSTRAQEGK